MARSVWERRLTGKLALPGFRNALEVEEVNTFLTPKY